MALFLFGEANMNVKREGVPERVGSCAQGQWARAGTSTTGQPTADPVRDEVGAGAGVRVEPECADADEPIEDEAGYGYGV
jgi:hypothetical protein